MAKKKQRIAVDSTASLTNHPFASLSSEGLPAGEPAHVPVSSIVAPEKKGKKKRVVKMRREKSGRGGKEVTLLKDFENITAPEIQDLLSVLKKRLGTGGKYQNQTIEIQGDLRDAVESFLVEKNFRVIRAGG